jgi:hypothetical protein
VKLYSRPGNDLTYRFPLIVAAAFLAGGDGDGRPFPADATAARSLGLEIKLFAVSNNGDGFREGAGGPQK